MKYAGIKILIVLLFCASYTYAQTNYSTAKPWTYWFWMGSAVNQKDIKIQLDEFSKAGLGGVHIVPVYGVKGYENQFIPFLSEKWLEMVQYTINQAHEIKLGVDISLGTGWPFGGSWINSQNAAKKMVIKEYQLKQTDQIKFNTDSIIKNNRFLELIGIVATNENGASLNLSSHISDKNYHQDVNPGNWKLSCFGSTNTNQKVKRAAPGGEGLVIDYFDVCAMANYLHHYASIFAETKFPVKPRSWFHDSYETYSANWSYWFTDRFKKLQGYDFTDALPILLDTINPQRPLVVHDFRETLSELLYSEFASPWTGWCRNGDAISRYQAHGSPGNLLDLYALSDIPETESFGCSNFPIPKLQCDPDYQEQTFGRPSPLMFKFASSPAHLLNKPLVSSETATWLAEHFKESLSKIKPQVDELFVSGINHVFYQGITYSPKQEAYPGWLFYASTNFGPSSHFWDELPLLNSYIEKCQSLLQNSTPDNDILLYFPIDDLWTKYPGDLLMLLDVHHYASWFGKSEFGKTSKLLWDNGFSFDYISDKQIKELSIQADGKLSALGNSSYSVIVVPPGDYINENTLRKLDTLSSKGAKILFIDKIPEHFAGLNAQKQPESELNDLRKNLSAHTTDFSNLLNDLKLQNIRNEEAKIQGLDFIRKKTKNGYIYFITNLSNRFYQDSISIAVKSNYIELFDPQNLKKGYIKTSNKFYLQLPPGKSCFIKTFQEKPKSVAWKNSINQDTIYLDKPWMVSFISGNNQNLKPVYKIDKLNSWTEWGDDSLKSFCGKAIYRSNFTIKNYNKSKSYQLVFDDIRETAKISINGIPCGTVWSLPYCIDIPAGVIRQENTIEITVQNLSANLMKKIDTQKIPWKKFYDINFVSIKYRDFDASTWADTPSGLIGKVMLIRNK